MDKNKDKERQDNITPSIIKVQSYRLSNSIIKIQSPEKIIIAYRVATLPRSYVTFLIIKFEIVRPIVKRLTKRANRYGRTDQPSS